MSGKYRYFHTGTLYGLINSQSALWHLKTNSIKKKELRAFERRFTVERWLAAD